MFDLMNFFSQWARKAVIRKHFAQQGKLMVCGVAAKRFPLHSQTRMFRIGGVKIEMFIDSGAFRTCISKTEFDRIASSTKSVIKRIATASAPKIMAFGSTNFLKITDVMELDICPEENPNRISRVQLNAVVGAQVNLLEWQVAVNIGVLRVGYEECSGSLASAEISVAEPNCISVPAFNVCTYTGLTIDTSTPEFPSYPGYLFRLKIKKNSQPRCFWYDIVKPAQVEAYKRELERYISQKIVEPVADGDFDRVSPAMAASKNHGKDVRLVINFVSLNEDLESTNEIIMPTVDEMTRFTKGKRVFAKIDLSSAFLHIVLDPRDRRHTVFFTRFGLFQCCRMMFGLKTAPQEFQFIMVLLLKEFRANAIIYLDDILIVAMSIEELREIYDKIMKKLKDANFKINEEKCEFGKDKVEIVGFVASGVGVELTPARIEVVKGLKIPSTRAELKSMLGFFTFFGHHIPSFAKTTVPLWELLKTSDKKNFRWDARHDRAFNELKSAAVVERILFHFDNKLQTYLMTDSSEHAVGAVLFQVDKNERNPLERIKIILFASKILPSAFTRMHQFEREIFGIVWSLNHCRDYISRLQDTECVVLTDLRTASIIMQKTLNHGTKIQQKRFERWVYSVYDLKYRIEWLSGKINVSDCPSRLTTIISTSRGSDSFEKNYVIDYSDDAALNEINESELQDIKEVCYICNVLRGDRWLKHYEVENETETDVKIQRIISLVRDGKVDEMPEPMKRYWKTHKYPLKIYEGTLLRGNQIVLPETLRFRALSIAHQSHLRSESMINLLKMYVWWPELRQDVIHYVANCEFCKLNEKPTPVPMSATPTPKGPWEGIALDFGDFPLEKATVMVVVDYFSRFTKFIPVNAKNTATILEKLDQLFSYYGRPEWLKHDGGPPMNGDLWKEKLAEWGIKSYYSAAEHPQGNGLAERQMQRLKIMMTSSWLSKTSWIDNLKVCEEIHNATEHKVTKKQPMQLMFGRKSRMGLPAYAQNIYEVIDWDAVRALDDKSKKYMKEYGDDYVRAKPANFDIGDLVYVSDVRNEKIKLKPNYRLDARTREPERWKVVSYNPVDKKYTVTYQSDLSDPKTKKSMQRDGGNLHRCPESRQEQRFVDILQDITSEQPTIGEVAGLPIEVIHTMDANSAGVVHEDLSEAVAQSINLHIDRENRQDKRAEAAMEEARTNARSSSRIADKQAQTGKVDYKKLHHGK